MGGNRYTVDFSQSLSSIDSWYTQIKTGCSDVYTHDRDLATLTFTDDDHLSTRLEGYPQVFTRSTLTLGSDEQIFDYTDGDFQLFYLANADSVTAIAKCNGQDMSGFFKIAEDRTSAPYLVYDATSVSTENSRAWLRFRNDIYVVCKIAPGIDDLRFVAQASIRTLFTQLGGMERRNL
ncbi:hypothetical protein FOZ63_015735 [Perkinsus olseni]|uniref:Uncharacterized protein n=1 Tax=Perkinsus olseni TaxID=32597 RepID=A0A7J6RBT4_PEROL|nr:hypothetical protein FOZ62_032262 [Perkinsus olseni]KAF4746384.1 hypothetical protein FOZ63_015735 [Perkinsus olseni]